MHSLNHVETEMLLLIECAYQDNNFSSPEINFLKKKYEALDFDKVLQSYHSMTTGQKIEVITDFLLDMASNDGDFDRLNIELVRLFKVDGTFCRFESEFLNFLKRIQISL